MCSGTDPACADGGLDEETKEEFRKADAPRRATPQEVEDIIRYRLDRDDGTFRDEIDGWVQDAYIAVFPHYITDCPGYHGRVAVVVYGGGPEFSETYIWGKDGKAEMVRTLPEGGEAVPCRLSRVEDFEPPPLCPYCGAKMWKQEGHGIGDGERKGAVCSNPECRYSFEVVGECLDEEVWEAYLGVETDG